MPPLGFDNSFAMVMRGDDARRMGLSKLSQLGPVAPQLKLGVGYEFLERQDGYEGLVRDVRLEIRGQRPRVMDLGLLYRALENRSVDIVAGSNTDGLIAALGLVVLEDDRHYFPPYDAVPIVRPELFRRCPAAQAAFDALAGQDHRRRHAQDELRRSTAKRRMPPRWCELSEAARPHLADAAVIGRDPLLARWIAARAAPLPQFFTKLCRIAIGRRLMVLYEYAYSCIFMLCRNCRAIPRSVTWSAARMSASQEELRRRLYRRGHRVTQATLSRDIHELRLVKTPEGYKFPQGEVPDAFLPSIERLIREFVYEVKTAQNLVVVKTSAGSAQPVSAAIDAEEWEEVVGTIGGDDTILVIAPDDETARKVGQTAYARLFSM